MGKLMFNGICYTGSGGEGSGNGGVYVDELIFDTYTTSNGTYALNNSIDNYDALLICGYGYAADDPTSMLVSQFVTKAEFDKYFALIATVTGQTRRATINFPDANHVTVSSIEGSIALKYIYGLKMSGNMFAPQIYSTEEREVGVWIDGKPLYQVTLTQNEVPALANTGQTRHINLGLSNIENIWVMDASITTNNVTNLPYIHYDTRNLVGYFWDMNNGSPILEVRTGDQSSGFAIECITLQYTKSTDTPGSGSWASNGVPAHHYSTDEQVVGTWIDGSTVYERTFDLSNVTASDFNWSNDILGTVNTGINIINYDGKFICWGSRFPYFYYRSGSEYWTSLINSTHDDIMIRPNLNAGGSPIYLGYITIQYTKGGA